MEASKQDVSPLPSVRTNVFDDEKSNTNDAAETGDVAKRNPTGAFVDSATEMDADGAMEVEELIPASRLSVLGYTHDSEPTPPAPASRLAGFPLEFINEVQPLPQLTRNANGRRSESLPGAYARRTGTGRRNQENIQSRPNNPLDARARDLEEQDQNRAIPVRQLSGTGLVEATPVEGDLPLAEGFDEGSLSQRRRKNEIGFRWFVLLLLACLVVVGAVSLLAVALGRQRDNEIKSNHSSALTGTRAPTVSPASISTWLQDLLPETTRQAIMDVTSPQARAFEWLMNDTRLEEYNEGRIIQRFALAVFYYATGGESWYNNTRWMTYGTHECTWPNINPDIPSTHQAVRPREFQKSPNSPCQCSSNSSDTESFKHLCIADNGLEGTIPEELWLLTSLKSLALHSHSNLVARISSQIGKHDNLELLDLNWINLEETIPSQIGLCSKLKFWLTQHGSLGGTIPTEIGNLGLLEFFFFGENFLTGTLPTELGKLENLRSLYAPFGGLGGMIPSQLGLLTNLVNLELGINSFSSTIPSQLAERLVALTHFGLSANALSGTILSEFGMLPGLIWFNLRANELTGTLPTQLGLLKGMFEFTLDTNHLSGFIPTEYGNFGRFDGMQDFWLSHNELSGQIPSELGQIPHMKSFWLQGNTLLTGPIPSELGILHEGLKEFNISSCMLLTGTIPSELCLLEGSNCTYRNPDPYTTGGVHDCLLGFDCSDSLCGCDCPCKWS